MPKGSSGIKRSGVSRILDKSKHELPEEFETTSGYVDRYVKDPNGTISMQGTNDKYRREQKYPVNEGFAAIKKAPLESIIIVHQPSGVKVSIEGQKEEIMPILSRGKKVPAHDEYYMVKQRTKTRRELVLVHTTNPNGYYLPRYGEVRSMKWSGEQYRHDIKTVKDIQEMFKYTDRITIYEPHR